MRIPQKSFYEKTKDLCHRASALFSYTGKLPIQNFVFSHSFFGFFDLAVNFFFKAYRFKGNFGDEKSK
jgi:hypothetical protein